MEIIRCENCQWSEFRNKVVDHFFGLRCENTRSPCRGRIVDRDFYCAYGELPPFSITDSFYIEQKDEE